MADKIPGRDTDIAQEPGKPAFSRRVSLDDAAAFHGRIEVSAADCARLAALYKIEGLSGFQFTYRIDPLASHRYRLTGDLSAEVTQLCVATLEPVVDRIKESVHLEFWPPEQIAKADQPDFDAELDDDPPEAIVDGKIDVGAYAAEILASAINPYPRKSDAEFAWEDPKLKAEPSGPFAQLAKLRPKS